MGKVQLAVLKDDLAQMEATVDAELPVLENGQVLLAVELFGLSANNISYADVGEMLGYWAYFPAAEGYGCVPVWGFAQVVESRHQDIQVGERVFGYLPMASHLVTTPTAINELCFSDNSAHRTGLHPWYNRYYRCAGDPLYANERSAAQCVLWALFMTGWMMADELVNNVDSVVISSASSKTALSLAWSLKHSGAELQVIGLTSPGNQEFVSGLGIYDNIRTYTELESLAGVGKTAFVDIAGNAAVTSAVHVALGTSLEDSVTIGATHRAPPGEALPMPGPQPRFFFIPDVAEERAAADGFTTYHGHFAKAWSDFAGWTEGWLTFPEGVGPDAIQSGYQKALSGRLTTDTAPVFSWS
ncbi:MAG: DUF2855 family protein [Pseudomonadota bacterium]